ncbi:MAG TPA: hypothetical protein VH479_14865 [Acidimicrobiales bacterium]
MATSELVGPDRLDTAEGESTADPSEQGARRGWVAPLAFALAVVPLIVAAVYLRVAHAAYKPQGDMALIELMTRDVGHQWIELGPYSRDGWNHPGPSLFYALALPYRLLGSVSVGLHVGGLLINGVSIAGMGLIARRRGGTPLMLITLLACALTVRSLGADPIRVAWNPWVTALPYGLLLFLTWAMACGERWALPGAVVVGTFVAQTHIGYVTLGLPLVVLGAVWLVVATPKGTRRRLVPPALLAVLAGAVMWLPTLLDQVTNDPGNLGLAARWFREGGPEHQSARTLGDGWRVVSAPYAPAPEWIVGLRKLWPTAEPANLYHPRLPVMLIPVAIAAVYLIRRKVPGAVQLVSVWLVASVVGIVATGRTVGQIYFYRLGWTWLLGMTAGIIVAWAGWTALAAWRPSLPRRVLVPVCLAGLAVLAVGTSVAQVRAGEPQGHEASMLRSLMPQVLDRLPDGQGEVIVNGTSFGGIGLRSALLLELERAGIPASFVPGNFSAGRYRADDGGPVRVQLRTAMDVEIADFLDEGKQLLAYSGSMPLEELRARAPAYQELQAARARDEAWTRDAGSARVRGADIPPMSAAAVFIEEAPPPP